jgi:hypothetical protein
MELIRRKRYKPSENDTISPLYFETLSQFSIQNIIKSRISKESFLEFLNKNIIEETISVYQEILDLDSKTGLYKDFNDSQKKYLFDLIMVILYEEVLTFADIKSKIISLRTSVIDVFEKIVVLEYGLFNLERSISLTNQEFDKIYILDNIKNIYHGNKNFTSYRDIENIEVELNKYLNGVIVPSEIPSDFLSKIFFRINERLSGIEKSQNIYKYIFLLNYNSTSLFIDKDLLRKYYAVTVNINTTQVYGYYYKDNEKIYLSGISTLSYYQYLTESYNADYKAAHEFLISIWQKLLDGTINY